MARGFPYKTHPTGWFLVGFSDEIPIGHVQPWRYFSQDLVAYRGASGRLVVLDAHCAHVGAHLGYGGKVDGDCIVCPFHAWKWSAEGRNVDIPYSRILHNNARLRTWHVWEESGLILLWHDAAGVAPYWQPMQFPPDPSKYYPVSKTSVVIRNKPMYPQWFMENLADLAHIKYVHLLSFIPDMGDYKWHGPNWGAEAHLPRPSMGAQGMSMIMTRGLPTQKDLGDYDPSAQVNIVAVTPVDDCVTDVFLVTYVVREAGYPDELGPRARRAWESRTRNVMLDFDIFDHLEYKDGPVWPPEESKMWNDFRKWARQFYPAETGIRSLPPGGGPGAKFVRQEDTVVGGRKGRGPQTMPEGTLRSQFDYRMPDGKRSSP